MPVNTPPGQQQQREVQRLLGRCVLRLQQYERLLKAMLTHQELAGPVDTLDAQRSARAEKLSNKTLGHLVNALFENFVVPHDFARELLPESTTPTDRACFAVSHQITMAPEQLDNVRKAIEELVKVRNDLVHHLTGIVSVLREASTLLAEEGWTSLEAAQAWVQSKYPEQTPEKYGCRSWQHVLHESKLFDLTYRVSAEGRKLGWFREQAKARGAQRGD
jgi:hypothetical protein